MKHLELDVIEVSCTISLVYVCCYTSLFVEKKFWPLMFSRHWFISPELFVNKSSIKMNMLTSLKLYVHRMCL